MKNILFNCFLWGSLSILIFACNKSIPILAVDLTQSKIVSPIKYGFHYEEIGMMGDGGLYAEMVRNRCFEEGNMPNGLTVADGYYSNIPKLTSKNNKAYSIDPLIGWKLFPDKSPYIHAYCVTNDPLNNKNTHSLKAEVKQLPISGSTGIMNEGFFGMNLIKGNIYRLSFYAKGGVGKEQLNVVISDNIGKPLSVQYHTVLTQKWKKYETVFTAKESSTNGRLLFFPQSIGNYYLDVVSMFPGDTWEHGKSVFRSDIMQNLKDFEPEFIRFPGGCIVHGVNTETMYHWKETIGDVANRPGAWSKWEPHYRTDGLGYHEFYELCEYLGCDAMYVTPSGLVCNAWVEKGERKDEYCQPKINIQQYVQDALDAIEYAIGSSNTKWGSKRFQNGHPQPFPLKYIEIGNEDFGTQYYENYDTIYKAIHKQYPELIIIANSIIGNTPDLTDKRKRLNNFKDPSTVKIFDEHYYKDLNWMINNYYRFDSYSRPGPDLFIGEMGINEKAPLNILGEAIFMLSMERNGDLNPMLAQRPLMRNWTYVNGKGNPLYFHTNSTSFKSINYYTTKLFRDNKIDRLYPINYFINGEKTELIKDSLFATAGMDPETEEEVLKVVNLSTQSRKTCLAIDNIINNTKVRITTLGCQSYIKNTPQLPTGIVPEYQEFSINIHFQYSFKPMSLTIIRVVK